MKVTREKIENRQAYLTIEMEPAEMETAMQGSYRSLSQKANIPGFRKGKAPRNVVETYLGKPRLVEEAIDHMLPQAYEQALKDDNITPFAQPELEITQADPLIFKAVVPLEPTVELGDYRSIRATTEPVDIKEESIAAVLEDLRHQHATWEPVDRALDYNDMAIMDINGEVADTPVVRKAASQYQVLKDYIYPAPGFPAQVVGMKKEEEKEFKLTYPEDYPSKELAGKEASFKVKLHEIKEEKLPELNDDFAGQVAVEYKTVGALREEVAKNLKLSAENTDLRMIDDGAGGWKVAPAKIELSFVNDGNEPIKVNTRDLAQGLVRLEVDGPDDDSVRMTCVDARAGRGETDVMVLDPGTGWTSQAPLAFPGRFGGVSYEILKPGRYSVTAIYSSSAKGFWTGVVQSNVVVFNVMGGPTPAGVPVKGLKIALSTDTPEILIDGDPAKLTITFTNVGTEPIKLDTYDLFWSRLKLEVIGPDGKSLKAAVIQALRDMPGPAEADYPILEPGKSWSAKSQQLFPGLFGARNFAIAQPGEYRLRVTYENKPPAKEGEVDPFAKGSWTGLVTSSELTINVIGLPKRPK